MNTIFSDFFENRFQHGEQDRYTILSMIYRHFCCSCYEDINFHLLV